MTCWNKLTRIYPMSQDHAVQERADASPQNKLSHAEFRLS